MYNVAMKLLIVEDDPDISDFIEAGFKAEGFAIDKAYTGAQGSYLARINPYDIITLDFSLPLKNGLEVCEEIRAAGVPTPIIFLSVVSDTKNKIAALSKGADDYLTKPFLFEELRERVRAILRRPGRIKDSILNIGDLCVDTERRIVKRENKFIYLTRKEYSLLEYLVRNAETTVSRSMILEHVWSSDSDPLSNTVEAHILRLRKKINAGHSHELIRNIPGRGYVLDI
jgi:two-component system OmpR family response regulator